MNVLHEFLDLITIKTIFFLFRKENGIRYTGTRFPIFIKISKRLDKNHLPLLLFIHHSFLIIRSFNSHRQILVLSPIPRIYRLPEIGKCPSSPPFPEISRGCNKTGPHLSLPRAPGALDRRENNSRGIVAASSAESCRESWAADRKALKPRSLRPRWCRSPRFSKWLPSA